MADGAAARGCGALQIAHAPERGAALCITHCFGAQMNPRIDLIFSVSRRQRLRDQPL